MNVPFEDPAYVRMSALEIAKLGVESTLNNSKHHPTMSDDDVKMAIVELECALAHQLAINEELIERIAKLEKKSIFRRNR